MWEGGPGQDMQAGLTGARGQGPGWRACENQEAGCIGGSVFSPVALFPALLVTMDSHPPLHLHDLILYSLHCGFLCFSRAHATRGR